VRVGLDARTLSAQLRSGVEQYVVNLVRAFARLEEVPEIVAYTDRPISDPDLRQTVSSGPLRVTTIEARFGWLRLALPWRLWRDHADLVHLPSTILPPLLPCPAVVTVHDLAWLFHPETYSANDLRMQHVALSGAAAGAARIITVSQATAGDLHIHYPHCADRITVIPLGVSPEFSPEGPSLSPNAFPGADRLGTGCVLYAGALQPRKNLLRLLAAYRQVLTERPAPPLVVAGAMTPYGQQLLEEAARLGLEQQVLFPGYLPEHTLASLYRAATVFVYPSLYEGFGLPVLEAMASGTPVVTSDISAMPEVAGDAALLVDPESTERLAWGISLLLADEGLCATLIQRGLARSQEYTWERTARETVRVYRQVGSEK
jgi:glycosyltransferase involved in cell wall biosynthesis